MKSAIWSNIFAGLNDDKARILEILSKIPIFEDMSKKELIKIERIVHLRHYDEGEIVFREGEPGVGMYMVKEGEVSVRIRIAGKNEDMVVATFATGQYFGDIALFSPDLARTASVTATQKSTLLGFCRPDLLNLIERDPLLGSKILKKLLIFAGLRLVETNKQLDAARQRISELEEKLSGTKDDA